MVREGRRRRWEGRMASEGRRRRRGVMEEEAEVLVVVRIYSI